MTLRDFACRFGVFRSGRRGTWARGVNLVSLLVTVLAVAPMSYAREGMAPGKTVDAAVVGKAAKGSAAEDVPATGKSVREKMGGISAGRAGGETTAVRKMGARLDPVKAEIYRMVFEDRSLLEKRVREALKHYLDDPGGVEIKMIPEDAGRLLAGRFKEITCTMRGTVVKDLRVEYAWLRLRNCTLDFEKLIREKKFRFKDEGKVDLLLKVLEPDINELFRKKGRKLKVRRPHIDFRPGHLRFSGGIKVLFFRNHVKVAGVLRVKDGDKLYFYPRWMNIDFLPVPGFIVRTITRRINPMATFDSFKFKVQLGVIRLTHDALYVATADLADRVDAMVAAELSARAARLANDKSLTARQVRRH